MKKRYMFAQDIKCKSKKTLQKLMNEYRIVLVGIKASIAWQDKFKKHG